MTEPDPTTMSATAIRDAVVSGRTTARAVATAFADAIAARDGTLKAFVWFDRDHLLRQADDLDARRAAGEPPARCMASRSPSRT